jgi:hypothetical protein
MSSQKIDWCFAVTVVAVVLALPVKLLACMPAVSSINGVFPSPITYVGIGELPGGG